MVVKTQNVLQDLLTKVRKNFFLGFLGEKNIKHSFNSFKYVLGLPIFSKSNVSKKITKIYFYKVFQILTQGQCCTFLYTSSLQMLVMIYSFCSCVLGKPFKSSPMFVSEAAPYPIEAHFKRSSLGQAPGLTHKHETKLEGPVKDKHSSL